MNPHHKNKNKNRHIVKEKYYCLYYKCLDLPLVSKIEAQEVVWV